MHKMMGARLDPDYGRNLPLDDEDLQAAAAVYGDWVASADERLSSALQLVREPMEKCFICRLPLRDNLNDGERGCWKGLGRQGLYMLGPGCMHARVSPACIQQRQQQKNAYLSACRPAGRQAATRPLHPCSPACLLLPACCCLPVCSTICGTAAGAGWRGC